MHTLGGGLVKNNLPIIDCQTDWSLHTSVEFSLLKGALLYDYHRPWNSHCKIRVNLMNKVGGQGERYGWFSCGLGAGGTCAASVWDSWFLTHWRLEQMEGTDNTDELCPPVAINLLMGETQSPIHWNLSPSVSAFLVKLERSGMEQMHFGLNLFFLPLWFSSRAPVSSLCQQSLRSQHCCWSMRTTEIRTFPCMQGRFPHW